MDGAGLCFQGMGQETRGNGLQLFQGGKFGKMSPGKGKRPWKELPREIWSDHPWRCPRKEWTCHRTGGRWTLTPQVGLKDLGGLFQPQRLDFNDSRNDQSPSGGAELNHGVK